MDVDPKIRYYALEAIYNVAKSSKPAILNLFPDIFLLLFRLAGDEAKEVKNASDFVADYLQQLIAEESVALQTNEPQNGPINMLVERLTSCMHVIHSSKRSFLLNWINFLDGLSIAESSLHVALPDLVPNILECLADEKPEVRTLATKLLDHFQRDIASDAARTDVRGLGAAIAINLEEALTRRENDVVGGDIAAASAELLILNTRRTTVQATAIQWLQTLVAVASKEIAQDYGLILKAALSCLNTMDHELQGLAISLSDDLLSSTADLSDADIDVLGLLTASCEAISSLSNENAQLEALRWIERLLPRCSAVLKAGEGRDSIRWEVLQGSLLQNLCLLLSANSERVALRATASLAALSKLDCLSDVSPFDADQSTDEPSMEASYGDLSARTMRAIFGCFRGISGARLLQTRGGMIFETICSELGAKQAFTILCDVLDKESDPKFARMVAASLSLVLLTSSRLQSARIQLSRVAEDDESYAYFKSIFKGFRRSIVAVLTLTLLGEAYDLAADLVAALASYPLLGSLAATIVELTQVVSLLEAPNFAPLRLSLLEPLRYPTLVTTLRRMLMLLPQGEAFTMLHRRLDASGLDKAILHDQTTSLSHAKAKLFGKRNEQKSGCELPDHRALVEDFVKAHTSEGDQYLDE